MSRLSAKYVSWKVLFDGVEIPWLSISIGVGVDFDGQAGIVLEPDPTLSAMRPRTNVSIFFYDNQEEATDDLDKYKLFWEGETSGFTYSKFAQGRSVTVTAEGQVSVFGRSKLFAHGFGSITTTPHVSGSLFADTQTLTLQQLFSFAIFGRAFDPKNDCTSGTPFKPGDVPVTPSYGDRVLSLLAFLSGYNANFRMQVIRMRLFGKIASIPDSTIDRLVPRAMVSQYFQQMAESTIPAEATLLDLVAQFNMQAFHHIVGVTAPKIPPASTNKDPVYLPGSTASDSVYAIGRPYLRNDYFFMPEMYYAVPPACNFIFPEFLQTLNVSRTFTAEPTRALMMDEHLGGGALAVVAPDEILRVGTGFAKARPDPAQFWSLNRDGIKVERTAESPYHSRTADDSTFNLFGAVSDQEIEKGILPVREDLPFEYFSAVSNLYDVSRATLDSLASKVDTLEKLLPKVSESVGKQTGYVYLVKALADHLLYLRRFQRSASAELVGHRWIVPGFPCVIFDTTVSYIGYVRACTFQIGTDGSETTGLTLDYVRPYPQVTPSVYKRSRIEAALDSMAKAGSAYDSFKKETEDQSQRLANIGTALSDALSGSKPYPKAYKDKFLSTFRSATDQLSIDEGRAQRLKTTRKDVLDLNYKLQAALSKDPSAFGPDEVTDDDAAVLAQATSLLSALYSDSVSQGKMATDTFNEAAIPPTPDVSTDKLRQTLSTADLKGTFPEDFFAPPVFGNMDFIDIEKAERLYSDVLGTKSVLTEAMKSARLETEKPFSVEQGSASGVLALRLNSYNKFVNLTKVLEGIFPIHGGTDPTVWSEQTKVGNRDNVPIRDWLESKYLRRTGLMSLRAYAKENLLDPTTDKGRVDESTTFVVLKPLKPEPITSEKIGRPLFWDNSLYSKIVDEFAICPRGYTLSKSDGSTQKIGPVSQDPTSVIRNLRSSVGLESLTTTARQAFWIEYARNHFGSRAFVGR